MADDDAYLAYHRLPFFIKVFSGLLRNDEMDDGYPTWTLKLTKLHLKRTIEIPYEFWQRHILINALEDAVYFLVDGQTWRILLEHSLSKIWIKHGWRRFKDANALVLDVRCHFKLVDAHDVQFYVWFDRP
ncbi:hypothetical protein AAHA92_00077 [Salvia divinorum]|uniref:TF-B3 domain-containing protein n=1 Tax=Salvia divinorum TaxID=28513 RepID=A0ABD1IIB5_SALDI